MDSTPAFGSSHTTGGILHGKVYGNTLNHADFPKATSGEDFFTGNAPVAYKIFSYVVYSDLVKFNVTPDPSLHPNLAFRLSTVPPLESAVVLKKVSARLESVISM
jgi:hypothetical protein